MPNEISIEAQPSPVWNNKHEVIGHFIGLFGPNNRGLARTLYTGAMQNKQGETNIHYFDTPEQALAAWEAAMAAEITMEMERRLNMTGATRSAINERGLYRKRYS